MSSSASPTGTSLVDLPPEILHKVGSFLDEKDARILRFTCRKIGAIASCYAFAELVFYLHYGDFEMLQHLANHDIISRNVKSLVYVTDILPERRLSYKKYVTKKIKLDDMWYELQKMHPLPASERSRSGMPPERPRYTASDYKANYDKYVACHSRQTEILASGEDFTLFRDIIPKFASLRQITVSADCEFREFKRAARPFDDLFVKPRAELQPMACRQIGSLLLPLVGLGSTLRTLMLGAVHWSFIRQFQDPVRFAQMVEICRNLTTFDLIIDTGISNMNEVGVFVPQVKETVRSGVLRRLLEAMPRLESLTVGFSFINEEADTYPAEFGDLVSANTHWEHLANVRFDCIEAHRQELVDFFRRHSSTLRTIEYKDLRLIKSSWYVILPQLRELAEDMFLDDILLAGDAQGETESEDEDEDAEPWSRKEYFKFGYPDIGSAELAEDVTDYIIWGKRPNPLELSQYS